MESKVLIAAALLLFAGAAAFAVPGFWTASSDAAAEIEAMTDEELVGQVLMLGYLGSEPTREFLGWIADWNIGGVKVFGWNTGNLQILSRGIGEMQRAALSKRSDIPLFIATDQEGGWVRHVKGDTSVTAGNLAIGASGLAYDAYQTGLLIGEELRILGINMNFAPTVDVYTNPQADVIGPRSFSADPLETAFLSVAYYRGLETAGVISTAKHFPGHGNADQDSHGTLPVIEDGYDTIWESDLLPYRFLIKEGLPAIMSGHLNFPRITGDGEPASLSPGILQDILRERLEFGGIVITDDMLMYGVRQGNRTVPEACEAALRAGNDMILVSRPPGIQIEVRDHLLEVISRDPDFKHIVQERVDRILRIKRRYLLAGGKDALFPDPEKAVQSLPNEEGKSYLLDLAFRSATLVKDDGIPVDPSESVLLVGDYDEFISEGLERFAAAEGYSLDSRSNAEAMRILEAAEMFDRIIFCLSNESGLRVLSALEPIRDKLAVLSVLTPVYLRSVPWVSTAVAVYGTGIESFKAGISALAGDFHPTGRLPIPLTDE